MENWYLPYHMRNRNDIVDIDDQLEANYFQVGFSNLTLILFVPLIYLFQ